MILLLNFVFYSGIIIPTIIALIDKFFDNNFFLIRIYTVLIILLYFIMCLYVITYFCVLRKIKLIKGIFEGTNY